MCPSLKFNVSVISLYPYAYGGFTGSISDELNIAYSLFFLGS